MPPVNRNSFSVSSLPLVPQHLLSTRMSEPFIVVIRRAATPEALCLVVKVALGIEIVSEPRDQAVQLAPHLGSQSCSTRGKECTNKKSTLYNCYLVYYKLIKYSPSSPQNSPSKNVPKRAIRRQNLSLSDNSKRMKRTLTMIKIYPEEVNQCKAHLRVSFAQTACCCRRDHYGGRHESCGDQELRGQHGRDADRVGEVDEELGDKVQGEVEAVRGDAEPSCEEGLPSPPRRRWHCHCP